MTHSTMEWKNKIKSMLPRALAILFWLGAWQLASMRLGKEILLVSPIRTAATLVRLIGQRAFYEAVFLSFARISGGFLLGSISGVALAAFSFRFPLARPFIEPPLHVLKVTPVASFVILALVWIPSRNLAIFISFIMAAPILYAGALAGLESADARLVEMAAVYRVPTMRVLRYIYLPAAYPSLLSSCTLALGMCWKSGVAAEVIGLPDRSIGEMLYQAKIFLNTPELFAWTLAIILLSMGISRVAVWGLNRLKTRVEGMR